MVNTYAVQSGGCRFESLRGFGFCLKGAHYEVDYCGKKTFLARLQCTLTSSCATSREWPKSVPRSIFKKPSFINIQTIVEHLSTSQCRKIPEAIRIKFGNHFSTNWQRKNHLKNNFIKNFCREKVSMSRNFRPAKRFFFKRKRLMEVKRYTLIKIIVRRKVAQWRIDEKNPNRSTEPKQIDEATLWTPKRVFLSNTLKTRNH